VKCGRAKVRDIEAGEVRVCGGLLGPGVPVKEALSEFKVSVAVVKKMGKR
jgi:DNA gyrase/topoisomerase IV subunit B